MSNTNTHNVSQSQRLSHLAASLFIISLFVLMGALFVYGIEVLLLVFAGILFGIFLRSLSNWLVARFHISDKIAVMSATLGLIVIVGLTGLLIAPSLSRQINQLAETLPRSLEMLERTISKSWLGRSILAKAPNAEQLVTNNGDLVQTVTNAFKITTTVIANTVAIFFLGLFFAAAPGSYTRGVIALIPRRREARGKEILDELFVTLSRWLQGQLIAMGIVAVFTTVGLWLLGVELALVLGLFAGLLAFVPNIGPVISAVPAIMIGLLESPTQAIYIAVLYIVVQTVESYMITPMIQKKMVSLPPAMVLSVQFLMGVVLGAMALALATPLAAAALVLTKMLYVHDALGKHTTLPGNNEE